MNIILPLTPHLEQFVRKQLASGHFQTEGDVLRAALQLLEDHTREPSPVSGDRLPGNTAAGNSSGRRSPRGMLADIRSYISPDDIREARSEMWSGFPRSEA